MKTSNTNSKFPWSILGNNLFPEYKLGKEFHKKMIFIVDDQVMYSNGVASHFEENNTEHRIFENGEDCLANMHLNPDIIILDFELDNGSQTKLNGIEVLKKIKEINSECEVIMLSGHEDILIATTSIKFGAFDYVVKNDHAVLNLKNRIINIYRKIDVLTQLKEVKALKTKITGIAAAAIFLAIASNIVFRY